MGLSRTKGLVIVPNLTVGLAARFRIGLNIHSVLLLYLVCPYIWVLGLVLREERVILMPIYGTLEPRGVCFLKRFKFDFF